MKKTIKVACVSKGVLSLSEVPFRGKKVAELDGFEIWETKKTIPVEGWTLDSQDKRPMLYAVKDGVAVRMAPATRQEDLLASKKGMIAKHFELMTDQKAMAAKKAKADAAAFWRARRARVNDVCVKEDLATLFGMDIATFYGVVNFQEVKYLEALHCSLFRGRGKWTVKGYRLPSFNDSVAKPDGKNSWVEDVKSKCLDRFGMFDPRGYLERIFHEPFFTDVLKFLGKGAKQLYLNHATFRKDIYDEGYSNLSVTPRCHGETITGRAEASDAYLAKLVEEFKKRMKKEYVKNGD